MTTLDALRVAGVCVCLGGIVGGLVVRWRNRRVGLYRTRLLDAIVRAAQIDHLHGHDDYQWRLDAYNAVTYEDMLWQVWRPLASFYPDDAFTRPR